VPRPSTAPALVVHTLDHIRLALRIAAQLGAPLTLLTPPHAARYAGPAYYLEMLRRARREQAAETGAEIAVNAILDCGDDAALALFALDMGWPALVLTGHRGARARVADIARQRNARILPRRPAAIDLATADDAELACRKALKAPRRRD
jgi:hypothetical protein